MSTDPSVRRQTLRELLTRAEKCARDLHERLQNDLLAQLTDFRDLSRPVRRRSHYPTLLAVQNSMKKLVETAKHVQSYSDRLLQQLEEIHERAQFERVHQM